MTKKPTSKYHGRPPCFWCGERRMERIEETGLFRCRNEGCPDTEGTGIGRPQLMQFGVKSGIYFMPLHYAEKVCR